MVFFSAAERVHVAKTGAEAERCALRGAASRAGATTEDRTHSAKLLARLYPRRSFQKHALALVRVWQHAQLEVGLSDQHRDHLSVGAPVALWDGFLIKWIAWMRSNTPDIAVSAYQGISAVMTQRLIEGTLHLAVMYRPLQPPGHMIEHLFDEEFVLVTSAKAPSRWASGGYVFIDWGLTSSRTTRSPFPNLRTPA